MASKKTKKAKSVKVILPPAPTPAPADPVIPGASAIPDVPDVPDDGPVSLVDLDAEIAMVDLKLPDDVLDQTGSYEAFYSDSPELTPEPESVPEPVPEPDPAPEPAIAAPPAAKPKTYLFGVYVGKILETEDDVLEHSYPHLKK